MFKWLNDTENDPEPLLDKNESENKKATKPITLKEIKKCIFKTPNKTPGDNVHPQHLKHGTEKLFKILAILFNASKGWTVIFADLFKRIFY